MKQDLLKNSTFDYPGAYGCPTGGNDANVLKINIAYLIPWN
ncbi:MAG: hypothetical protein WCQ70_08115 [Lentimicrobiaceae bacterium]